MSQVDGQPSIIIPSISNTQREDQTTEKIEDDTTSQNAVQKTPVPRNDKALMVAEKDAEKDVEKEITKEEIDDRKLANIDAYTKLESLISLA